MGVLDLGIPVVRSRLLDHMQVKQVNGVLVMHVTTEAVLLYPTDPFEQLRHLCRHHQERLERLITTPTKKTLRTYQKDTH